MRQIEKEKGSMAVFVSVALLSMLFILMALFMTSNSMRRSLIKTVIAVKESYEADNSKADDIYTILTEEEY